MLKRCMMLLVLVLTIASITAYADSALPQSNQESPRVLERGSRGDIVLELQRDLALAGYYNGDVDGIFGGETKNAVEHAQQSLGVQPNGVADTRLMMWLREKSEPVSRGMRSVRMTVTAYSPQDPGCGSYTYRGTYLRRGLCAVDPSVIPLGTRLYIPGYGMAVADDIGSAIKGLIVDVAYDTRGEALEFGRRQTTVFILN